MSTKDVADSLFSRTRKSVLCELVRAADSGIHIRELARRTGLDASGVQRELKNLASAGIVAERISGNQKYYAMNADCPVYSDLKMLILKTVGLTDVIREALGQIQRKINFAFLYGSIAEGTYDSESDVDLMIIGNAAFNEVVDAIMEAESAIGREINATVYTLNEFRQELTGGSRFINHVLKGKLIFLKGTSDELKRAFK